MNGKLLFCGVCALPILAACQSTADYIATTQPKAISTAEGRGRLDLNCPSAKGAVMGEQDVSPAVGLNMPSRAVFTIRVAGCEKLATYVIACPDDGSGKCFVADSRR